jgi:holliday junction DNA helicase RuvA
MISRLRGVLARRELDAVEVMTAGGVGYEVQIPAPVFERLPREGGEVELHTWQVVREDDVALYGFLDRRERAVFGRLLTAPGVGPRLALAILSALTPERLARAVADRDVAALQRVPGIGRKTAERLVLDLADKLDDLAVPGAGAAPEGRAASDAVGALVALGYSQPEANAAVRRALTADGGLDRTALIRAALALAQRGG